jgi:hypothetical protein
VTEAEWLACIEPGKLLGFLVGKASDRKLRLFAVACCRRIWDLMPKGSRKAVQAAKKYAEGTIDLEELRRASRRATNTFRNHRRGSWTRIDQSIAAMAAYAALRTTGEGPDVASMAAEFAAGVFGAVEIEKHGDGRHVSVIGVGEAGLWLRYWRKADGEKAKAKERQWESRLRQGNEDAWWMERRKQTELIRCLFGNPFNSRSLDNVWLMWNCGTVPKLTQAIYDDRRFSDLPILADALEEASCTDADVLSHCRSEGPHVRGCWVIDLLLGKD